MRIFSQIIKEIVCKDNIIYLYTQIREDIFYIFVKKSVTLLFFNRHLK